jgi:pimeloyl-ACP methyl ester carboxylesterase
MDGPERDIARPGLIRSADGISVAYDPAYAAETFYNMTSPAKAKWAISRLTPQPVAPMLAPLMLSEARFGRVTRAYVECMEDNTLPIAMQRQMRDALPCDPVITLNADHSPFLSAPHELAAALIAIAYSFTAQ